MTTKTDILQRTDIKKNTQKHSKFFFIKKKPYYCAMFLSFYSRVGGNSKKNNRQGLVTAKYLNPCTILN